MYKYRVVVLVIMIIGMFMFLVPAPIDVIDLATEDSVIYIYGEKENEEVFLSTTKERIVEITTTKQKVKNIVKQMTNIKAKTVVMQGDAEVARKLLLRLDAQIVDIGTIEDSTIIYAYSKRIRKYVVLDGTRINVEISYNKSGKIFMGSPLIMGSY